MFFKNAKPLIRRGGELIVFCYKFCSQHFCFAHHRWQGYLVIISFL